MPTLRIAMALVAASTVVLADEQPVVVQARSVVVARITDDGRWLLTGDESGTVQRFDLHAADVAGSASTLGHHTGGYGIVRYLEVDRAGRWLAATYGDHAASLWDLTASDIAGSRRDVPVMDASSVRPSPDGRWLVVAGTNGALRLYALPAKDLAQDAVALQGHEGGGRVIYPAISDDGRWMATGADRGPGFVWDLGNGTPPTRIVLKTDDDAVRPLAISPDGRWLVSGSERSSVNLWDLRAAPALVPIALRGHKDAVGNAVFSPDGRWLATASSLASDDVDAVVRLWDLGKKDVAGSAVPLAGHKKRVRRMAFSPDGRRLATTSDDGTARVWDLASAHPEESPIVLRGHGDPVLGVAIGKDGRWLATSGGDGTARLWDLRASDVASSGRVLAGDGSGVDWVRFSADGRWVMGQTVADAVLLWKP